MKSKSNFLFAALTSLVVMAAFNSCEKEEDDAGGGDGVINNNTITAKVVEGNDYNGEIDLVKALIVTDEVRNPQTGRYEWAGYEVGSGSYSKGGFTLKLLSSVDDQYLEYVSDRFDDALTISNPDAKIGGVTIVAYDESGYEIGGFELRNEEYGGGLLYANSNVSITGDDGGRTGRTFNLQFKKGWNMMYGAEDSEITTKAPSGLKWYFHFN